MVESILIEKGIVSFYNLIAMSSENTNWGKSLFTLVLLLGLTLPVGAGEISVSSSLDKTDIAYEDEIHLKVELKWVGPLNAYSFEILPLPETEKLQVAGSGSKISTQQIDGQDVTIRAFEYSFIPTMPGTAIIMPITFNYVSWPDSTPGQLATQQYNILISKPIPVEKQIESSAYIYILILVGIIVIAGVLIVIYFRKKSGSQEPFQTSEERFLNSLSQIKQENHTERNLFYNGLYKAIITYLESKYEIISSGKTAGSILKEINDIDLPVNQKEYLLQLIEKIETEKYAPTRGEPGDILRLCTELENHFKENK